LSVEKTAEKIGISAQALRCALRGETELRCETAKKLAELLKVNLLDLYVKNKETQEEIRKNIIEGYLYSEEFTGIEQKE
ncbi:helix-turn-helix transcriptional regulator, partial [Acinetobacter baumannii]|nr:helix-turn-helix transcriptional regulator [Acinetobacter baumannii]